MARKPAPAGGDRRQRILEAALALFAEQGLEGATSKDIAERAEVTHGLIYFYFKTKEDLFKAAFEYALERALEQLDLAAIAQSNEPPEQALAHLLMRFLETLNSPLLLRMSRLMMHTMAHKDWRDGPLYECKQHVHSTVVMVVDAVRAYLDRQLALGRLRPVNTEIVAKFLIGGVVSSVRWAQVEGLADSQSRDTAMVIADAFVRGLLVTPADTSGEAPDSAPTAESARLAPAAVGARALVDE
ncbi:MAG TPA: TetR/AcrR family transcriptional regulator [Ktedonobacterales bacterium]|jgi:AcrR family transcriptional regulator